MPKVRIKNSKSACFPGSLSEHKAISPVSVTESSTPELDSLLHIIPLSMTHISCSDVLSVKAKMPSKCTAKDS